MEDASRPRRSGLRVLKALLLIVGLLGIGYYGYTLCDEYIYQAYENWAFDQQIAGHGSVAFSDYVRAQTPFGFLLGTKVTAPVKSIPKPVPVVPNVIAPPPEGALLGRVEINRLHLSAIVRQGVDAKMLALAVGHVPSTALPGQVGNFAIAAHRDTLFRALKDIRKDDQVSFQSTDGTYSYQVLATKIVKPTDISVLNSNGGGLIPGADGNHDKLLTMITCYPFYYVGSAPNRFIVEAKLVSDDPASKFVADGSARASPPAHAVPQNRPKQRHRDIARQAYNREPRTVRGSSHMRTPEESYTADAQAPKPKKKRGFWHKVLPFRLPTTK
jgi:sortase A